MKWPLDIIFSNLLPSVALTSFFVFSEAFPKMASHQPEEPAVVRDFLFSVMDELAASFGVGEGRHGGRRTLPSQG